ncbi:MAG: AEC family transporter [Clostridium sp.]|nr:AEC family transporter [Clostridium sp.]
MGHFQNISHQIQTLFNQISILVIIGFIGYISGKTRYLPDNSGAILSRLVVKLTAPILIFITLASRDFTKDILINGIWIYLLGIFFIMLSFVFGHLIGEFLKLEGSTKNIFKMHFMFGNVIYLAFPLLRSLYGDDILLYAVLFNLANDTIMWTLGIFLVNKHNRTGWKDNIKHLINGNTIAFAAGLTIILLKVNFMPFIERIPHINEVSSFISSAFYPLGEMTAPLSMVFIGLILSEIRIKNIGDLFKRSPVFVLSLFKLIIIPCLALFALSFISFVDPLAKALIVLQLSMPCGTIVPALAEQYGSDYKFATENVFFTTIFSIVTMPFIVYLLAVLG